MLISLIVAHDEERGIAREGKIPWHLPGDLKRFKALTMGHHLVMGRKTFEAIGKRLPGRTSIVVTRQENTLPVVIGEAHIKSISSLDAFPEAGIRYAENHSLKVVYLARSLEEAMSFANVRGERELFIIGGGEVYAQALEHADLLYLTIVQGVFDCDVFFPEIKPSEWAEIDRESFRADESNPHASEFIQLRRIS
jgi:dihydrofolate reductase